MPFVKWLEQFFRRSSRVHVRSELASVTDAIGVIDRFIDGKPTYPLEWDDFVSWESSLAGVERLRQEVAELEPMFFAADESSRLQAHRRLVEIRNRYASLNGIGLRADPVDGTGA